MALRTALNHYDSARPGCKIFGGNLYLTAFDADGHPFDLTDARGESLIITIEAKSGELVRPALTAEGEQRRRDNAAIAKAEREKEARERKEKEALWWNERRKEEADRAERKRRIDALNKTTARRLEQDAESFLCELNGVIQSVWDELKPTETKGNKKGSIKAQPVFSCVAGVLHLTTPELKNPKKLKNPVGTAGYRRIETMWAYEAWGEAARRMLLLMEPQHNPPTE